MGQRLDVKGDIERKVLRSPEETRGAHGEGRALFFRNTEQNQMSSVKKVVSIDLPEYNVAISMSRSDKFVYS